MRARACWTGKIRRIDRRRQRGYRSRKQCAICVRFGSCMHMWYRQLGGRHSALCGFAGRAEETAAAEGPATVISSPPESRAGRAMRQPVSACHEMQSMRSIEAHKGRRESRAEVPERGEHGMEKQRGRGTPEKWRWRQMARHEVLQPRATLANDCPVEAGVRLERGCPAASGVALDTRVRGLRSLICRSRDGTNGG